VPLDKYAGQKLNFYLATDTVTKGKPTDPIEAFAAICSPFPRRTLQL
jgi:hypothetical protein